MLFHKLRHMGGGGIGFHGHQLFGHDIARLGAMGAGVMLSAPGRVAKQAAEPGSGLVFLTGQAADQICFRHHAEQGAIGP